MVTGYLDNYYARLGVSRHATQDEIRAAYHQAARRLHPDTNKDPGATELFLQIQEAYETLSNATKRLQYDKTLPTDITHPPDVMTNAIYSRDILPVSDTPQLVYIMLDLMARPEPGEGGKRPPLNLCLVLDTSTSMKGMRLDAVKQTATQFIRALQPHDILSIVTFNDRAEVIIPASRGLDLAKVESRVSILHTRGGTEIYMGLEAGMNEITRFINPSFLNHIYLITDGRTYGDEDKCLLLADNAKARGVTINGMGIGHEWNDEFLDDLSSRTGGSSEFASNPESVQKILRKKFGSIGHVYANNVKMKYTTPPEVELRYAFRLIPDPTALSLESNTINIGDIPIGRSLSLLMEYYIHRVPDTPNMFGMIEGDLELNIPTRPIPKTTARFNLSRPVAVDPEITPPPQVLVKAMSRLSLYRMQEQARIELASGEVEKATTRLNNLAVQLLTSGETELAHTVRLELDKIEHGGSLSEEAQKRIKYGTRALVMPSDTEND